MERKQIGNGAYITVLDSQKFNRCRITLHFQFPANREQATAAAVLPLVLERGYADCPDMTELSRRLAKLYGADLAVDNAVNGGNRILTVEIVVISTACGAASACDGSMPARGSAPGKPYAS